MLRLLAQSVVDPFRSRAALESEVVVLRHYQNLSYAEIGRILEIREDAARANHYQALRRLRQKLNDREREA